MKQFRSLFLIFLPLTFALLSSCKPDEETYPPNQNTIETFLFQNKDVKVEQINSAGPHVVGFQFSTILKGKINQIGINSPEIGLYKVYLMDSASKTIAFEDTISQKIPDRWTYRDVYPIPIGYKVKYYFYTRVLSNKKFNVVRRSNPDNSKLKFPLTVDNITIDNLIFDITGTGPKKDTTTAFYGLIDFTFRQDRY